MRLGDAAADVASEAAAALAAASVVFGAEGDVSFSDALLGGARGVFEIVEANTNPTSALNPDRLPDMFPQCEGGEGASDGSVRGAECFYATHASDAVDKITWATAWLAIAEARNATDVHEERARRRWRRVTTRGGGAQLAPEGDVGGVALERDFVDLEVARGVRPLHLPPRW